jgi:hypothetical protein
MRPQNIKSDGKNYTFTPGEGGSLINTDTRQQSGLNIQPSIPQAKIISAPIVEPIHNGGILQEMSESAKSKAQPIRQNRSSKPVIIGAVRG